MNSVARTIKFNYVLRLAHAEMKFYPTSLQLCAQVIDSICMNWCISNSSLRKPAKATACNLKIHTSTGTCKDCLRIPLLKRQKPELLFIVGTFLL